MTRTEAATVKDFPIIMSAPMVRALLDGRKTMTRRLAWHRVKRGPNAEGALLYTQWNKVKPGDRIWVRETFKEVAEGYLCITRADYPECVPAHFENVPARGEIKNWQPSIFMPRKRSRLTLIVTATKTERLQEISEDDARREGFDRPFVLLPHPKTKEVMEWPAFMPLRDCFASLWTHLNGPDAWEKNPEVVAITFTVHKQNIDTLPASVAA